MQIRDKVGAFQPLFYNVESAAYIGGALAAGGEACQDCPGPNGSLITIVGRQAITVRDALDLPISDDFQRPFGDWRAWGYTS